MFSHLFTCCVEVLIIMVFYLTEQCSISNFQVKFAAIQELVNLVAWVESSVNTPTGSVNDWHYKGLVT